MGGLLVVSQLKHTMGFTSVLFKTCDVVIFNQESNVGWLVNPSLGSLRFIFNANGGVLVIIAVTRVSPCGVVVVNFQTERRVLVNLVTSHLDVTLRITTAFDCNAEEAVAVNVVVFNDEVIRVMTVNTLAIVVTNNVTLDNNINVYAT